MARNSTSAGSDIRSGPGGKPGASAGQGTAHPGMGFGEFVTIVAAMMAVNALAIDIMLPALPAIGGSLGVTDANANQLVISAYLIGFGISQLFYGTITDRYGRKSVLIIGLTIYSAFGAMAIMASTFDQILFARTMQGVGAAATRVIAVSIVRDCYGGRPMAKVMSLVMIVFIAVPVVAPSIGQLIVLFGPWQWIFGLLTILGVTLAIWIAVRLPETLPPARRTPISPQSIGSAFGFVLTSRMTVGYGLGAAVIMGGLFGFINSAQQVFVEVFELGAAFPVVFSLIALSIALASIVNSRIVERIGMRRVSHTALLLFTAVCSAHALVALLGFETIYTFVGFQALTMFAFGLIMPNFNAMAMDPLGHVAGTGSAFVGALSTVGGTVLGYFIGQAYDGSVVPMTLGMAVLGAASIAIVMVTEKGRLFKGLYG